MRLSEIGDRVEARLEGTEDPQIAGIAHFLEAGPQDLVYVEKQDYATAARSSQAGAFLLGRDVLLDDSRPSLRAVHPMLSFIKALQLFEERSEEIEGPEPSVSIGPDSAIDSSARIEAGSVIGKFVKIGADVRIGPNCVIGDGVSIGARSVLKPGVVIGSNCQVGEDCILQPGAVIGSDGFGYFDHAGERYRVPHLGRVVLEAQVEIGANSTIDRAVLGSTIVGRGTKIDNLVQIAHNCQVGSLSYFAAQSGIAGSCQIGNGVTLAGQSGVSDHIRVGDGAIIIGKSAVREHVEAGQIVGGIPARSIRTQNEIMTLLPRLPEMEERLRRLESPCPETSAPERTLAEEVTHLLAEQLQVSADVIRPDLDLKEHFGADSLTVLTLMTEIEARFDIGIPDHHVRGLTTARQIVAYLETRV